MARFTFPATSQANLIFKLNGSQNGDSNAQFNVVSGTEVSGQVTSGNFCGGGNSYTVYFDMQFNQSFAGSGNAYVTFNTTGNQTVLAKVGVSYVSIGNAKANLSAENANWDFGSIQSAAHSAWNSLLGQARRSAAAPTRSSRCSTPRSTTRCCTRT